MNNKKILFLGFGDRRWLGGLYYIKNIIFMLINSKTKNLDIYLLTTKQNFNIYKKFETVINIIVIENEKINKIKKIISFFILKKNINKKLVDLVAEHNINYIYPVNSFPYLGLEEKCIHWIPDFQHKCLPQYFPFIDKFLRNFIFRDIIKSNRKLILSSHQAKENMNKYYGSNRDNVNVLHFVSDIEDFIENINDLDFNIIQRKYNINKKYCYIPNQFWSYKNHKVAFEGIKKYNDNNPQNKLDVICTGSTKDSRNPKYFDELMEDMEQKNITNIKILGLIPRLEQLQILKNAEVVIQPSLFEGWGTGVEEAKRLGLKIIMSDIPVHLEQMNNNNLVFKKNNPEDLGKKIEEIMKFSNITKEVTLKKMQYNNCKKYVKGICNTIGVEFED